jgi:hypothetical protein
LIDSALTEDRRIGLFGEEDCSDPKDPKGDKGDGEGAADKDANDDCCIGCTIRCLGIAGIGESLDITGGVAVDQRFGKTIPRRCELLFLLNLLIRCNGTICCRSETEKGGVFALST